MRMLPLLLLLTLPAVAQDLVGVRPLVVADDPVLRLGDVFEGAGPRAA
jgi:flagellar basal body P-ring formation protein FlgA